MRSNEDPTQPKINKINKFIKKKNKYPTAKMNLTREELKGHLDPPNFSDEDTKIQ